MQTTDRSATEQAVWEWARENGHSMVVTTVEGQAEVTITMSGCDGTPSFAVTDERRDAFVTAFFYCFG